VRRIIIIITTTTIVTIFVAKAEEKDEDVLLRQKNCMTSSTFQHHIFTLNPTKMPAKINGQFSPPNIPHSPFKPSLSSYHLHTDPTQYQPLQPDQSAAITYLRVQSLHQLVFHVVDLAKRVPGFQLMTQHDQLQLIKRQFSTSSSSLLLILIYYYYSRQ